MQFAVLLSHLTSEVDLTVENISIGNLKSCLYQVSICQLENLLRLKLLITADRFEILPTNDSCKSVLDVLTLCSILSEIS